MNLFLECVDFECSTSLVLVYRCVYDMYTCKFFVCLLFCSIFVCFLNELTCINNRVTCGIIFNVPLILIKRHSYIYIKHLIHGRITQRWLS